MEIQLEKGEHCYHINQFNSDTWLWISHARTWISIAIFSCLFEFSAQWFKGDVVVRFADIGQILDDHYLNFLNVKKTHQIICLLHFKLLIIFLKHTYIEMLENNSGSYVKCVITSRQLLRLKVSVIVYNASFNIMSIISWRSALIGGWNRMTRGKPLSCRKSLTNFIT